VPLFEVTLNRTAMQSAQVRVEAATAKAARELVEGDPNVVDPEWEIADIRKDETVVDVTEIEPEDEEADATV
jgi:hypothetical protein